MKKIGFYLGFVLLSFLVLWLLHEALFALQSYHHKSQIASASIRQWDIKEHKETFYIQAFYSFLVNEKKYEANTLFSKKFLHKDLALSYLEALQKKDFTVFYDPQNPSISTLEKLFPWSIFIKAVFVLLILIYFIGMREWIKKKLVC